MTNSEGLCEELEVAQQVNEDAELVIAVLAAQVARLERTVAWLTFGLAVPMILLGLVVGLTLIG